MRKPINIKSILAYSTLSVLIISLFVSNKKIDFSKGDNLLFHNGPIITMDVDRPSAESVYIENGIIKSIGDYENIRSETKGCNYTNIGMCARAMMAHVVMCS